MARPDVTRSCTRAADRGGIRNGESLSTCYDSTGRFDDRKMAQGGGTGTCMECSFFCPQFFASSKEFVVGIWLWKGSKIMISCDFVRLFSPRTVGLSGDQFCFVVEAFDNPWLLHDVKPINCMYCLTGLFGNHFQVGLPHVATYELQASNTLPAQETKELQQSLHRPIRTNP